MKKFTTALMGFSLLFLSGCDLAALEDAKRQTEWQKQRHIERENDANRQHEMELEVMSDRRWRQYAHSFFEVLHLLALIGVPAAAGWACWYMFLKKEAAIEHHKLENEERQKQREDLIRLTNALPQNERSKFLASSGTQALLGGPPS